jgi:putative transposase
MVVLKAYKFRIYPTAEQETLFWQTIGCCRLVYNLCLDQKKLERERSSPRKLTAFDQINELPELKRQFEFLKEAPANSLQQVILDLHKGFKNFFEGRAGFPRFRKKGQNDAFRHPDPKQIKIEDDRIFMPKSGWTRMVMHRPIFGTLKSVTVSEVAGNWHVSIQVEQLVLVPVNHGAAIGLDLGGVNPIVLSDGMVIDLPRTTAVDRKRLAAVQRIAARRKKGSRNRAKAQRKVARLQARYARRRKDAVHKATTMIAKNHGVIVIEDLKVSAMTKSGRGRVEDPGKLVQKTANQNRSLLDVSPRMIRTMLEYKAPWYGSRIVAVDPAQTSQCCNACGNVDAASRISRCRFVCTNCGSIFDADVNAAKNILRLGISPTGGLPGMACESSRTAGRKQEADAREGGSSALGAESSHPKIPCMYQPWDPVAASSPSPARKIQNRSPASSSTWK